MFNLDEVLNSKPYSMKEAAKKEAGPAKVQITPGALLKAKTYARLVERITGSANECYGFLLSRKDDDSGLVVDAYLADNQTYSGGHCKIDGEDVVKAAEAVDPKGYKIVGWWHSHARMNVFHSGTDVDNFETVVHSVAPNTLKTEYEDMKLEDLVKNGKLDFGGYVITAEQLKDSDIKKKHSSSWAYSVVVNILGDVYTEVQAKELGPDNKWNLNKPKKAVGFILSEIENDISIDAKLMENEVYQKLNVRRYAPVTKIAVAKAKDARRWGWFDFFDYVAGWFCGSTKKPDAVDSINDKIEKELIGLKEQKEKDYEKKVEEEKKQAEEEEKKQEELKKEEEQKIVEEAKGAAEVQKKPVAFGRLAERFYNNAKEYITDNNKKEAASRHWLDKVLINYITGQTDFVEAINLANITKTYTSINYSKEKHKSKFVPRFAEDLSKSRTLCQLVAGFIDGEEKVKAVNALNGYKLSAKTEDTVEETETPPEKKEAGPAEKTSKEEKTEKDAVKIPVRIVKGPGKEDDPLVALVREDITKQNEKASGLAEQFLDAFIDYIEDSYANKKPYQYNEWAVDTYNDFKQGYSGRSETFMRAARCNLRTFKKNISFKRKCYSTWGKDRMLERATKEFLNSAEFKQFVAEFLKEKDKDSVLEKYFKKESEEKAAANEHWYDYGDCPRAVIPGAVTERIHFIKEPGTPPKISLPATPSFEPTEKEHRQIFEKVYEGIFDSFFQSAKDYMFKDGEYAAWLGSFLIKLAGKKEDDIKKPVKKPLADGTKKVLEENVAIEEDIRKRFDWCSDGKPSEAEIKDRLFLEFIAGFKPENIPGFYAQMSEFTRDSMIANAFAKAMSDYTMEGWCFDKKPCKRKYCSWAGSVLEDIIRPEKLVAFDSALKSAGELKSDLEWSTDYFYTEKDKTMIANQLLLDLTCFVEPEKKQQLREFLMDFVNAYKSNGTEDPDAALEKFIKAITEVKECKQPSQK